MRVPSEDIEAESLAYRLRANWYIFTHVANESWLPPKVAIIAAMKKKRMWLSPWVPDFIIILKRWSLLFIELKRQRIILKNGNLWASPSKISEEQKSWIEKLWKIENVEALIAFWHKEAIEQIKYFENL